MKHYAVSFDGAPLPGGSFQTITVRCKDDPNITFHIQEIVNAVGRPLKSCEQDWLDLLRAIHVADLVCHRGENEEWNRDIELSLPLRDVGLTHSWLPLVQEVFGRMTHDSLKIHVVQENDPATIPLPRRRAPKVDAVALLSGGIDSASAATSLLRQSRHPCFVSYRASSHIRGAQNAVVASLSDKFKVPVHSAKFGIDLRHQHRQAPLPDLELSQRSRTLLFTGVAAVVAVAHGIQEVILGENGVMAINCPPTPGRWAGFSTHTAHPDVLALMGKLFSRVLGKTVRVVNPLRHKTKTEVVADLVAAGLGSLVPATRSCWIARQAIQCGVCVPCVVRRLAVEAAGAPDRPYDHDVFQSPPPPTDRKFNAIGDYLSFALQLDSLSDEELLLDYSELNVEGGSTARAPILQAHRRWARDVLAVARGYPALAALL